MYIKSLNLHIYNIGITIYVLLIEKSHFIYTKQLTKWGVRGKKTKTKYLKIFFTDFREKERGREEEKHQCDRETLNQ